VGLHLEMDGIGMAGKQGGKSNEKSDINELRVYFSTLNTPQKKVFIQNLRQKLSGVSSVKYNSFLTECIQTYNQECNKTKATNADKPDISSELFAKAISSMLAAPQGGSATPVIGSKLVGTWQRKSEGEVFYYKFNNDGTFETNEVVDHKPLIGHYKIGIGDALHMEPVDLLQISSLTVSLTGSSLTIGRTDGSIYDYKRKK